MYGPYRNAAGEITGVIGLIRDVTERKRMEQDIRALASFPSENPNPILRLDRQGTVLSANKASNILSCDLEVGQTAPRFWRDLAAEALSSGRSRDVDCEFDGRSYMFLVKPIMGMDYVNLYGTEVTERKRAEEALRELQALSKSIIDSQSDLIWSVDAHSFALLTWNQALTDYYRDRFGISIEKGMHTEDLMPTAELASQWRKFFERALKEPSLTLEYCMETTSRTLQLSFNHILRHGMVTGISVFAKDITERKRAEEKLREREEDFRRIFEQSPLGVALLSPDYHFQLVNDALCGMLGYSSQELTALKFTDITHPDDLEQSVDLTQKMKRGETAKFSIEKRYVKKNGGTLTAAMTASYIRDGAGQPVHSLAIIEDISERKQLEDKIRHYSEHLEQLVEERTRKLAESERKYRELFMSSPVSLWEEDFSDVKRYLDELRSKGVDNIERHLTEHPEEIAKCAAMVKVLGVNKATMELYGSSSVEDLLSQLRRVLSQESVNNFREELVALDEGKTPFEGEFDNQSLKVGTKHVKAILNVLPGYEETLGKVLISVVDLTDQKRMEEELQAAKKRLEYVINSNPAVIYSGKPLADLSDWRLTYVSSRVIDMAGFEPRELIDHSGTWNSRIHPDDFPVYLAGMPRLFKSGHGSFDYRLLHKDESYRWIREEITSICDADGKPSEVIGCWTDITELKEMEQRLKEAEHLAGIGEAATMVGHDLRNPLQGIAAAVYVLKDESSPASTRNEMIRLIESCVDYSDGIVKDLLDYARPLELVRMEISPKGITTNALQTIQVPDRIRVKNLTREQPPIAVDQDRMKRVFVNLIENAVDAMPNGGTLTITSKESEGFVEIAVSDTGGGLPKGVFENLWKPLQTTKAKGMGLAIAKRIVVAHGGEITVESKQGEGTTFNIRLPTKVTN
jgi:PAS domain S-box-containing protein